MDIKNRIVGSDQVDPSTLTLNASNFRRHPQNQADLMKAVLDEVGWASEIIVNQRTGRVIDGHLRVAIAIQNGEPLVPVSYVDLSENEERIALASFDYVGSLATVDVEVLGGLLDKITTSNDALQTGLSQFLKDASGDLPAVEVDQVQPELTVNTTMIRVGDVTFLVGYSAFKQWLEAMRQTVGFGKKKLADEIMRRLGITFAPKTVK